jgi:hypothetical protein
VYTYARTHTQTHTHTHTNARTNTHTQIQTKHTRAHTFRDPPISKHATAFLMSSAPKMLGAILANSTSCTLSCFEKRSNSAISDCLRGVCMYVHVFVCMRVCMCICMCQGEIHPWVPLKLVSASYCIIVSSNERATVAFFARYATFVTQMTN